MIIVMCKVQYGTNADGTWLSEIGVGEQERMEINRERENIKLRPVGK